MSQRPLHTRETLPLTIREHYLEDGTMTQLSDYDVSRSCEAVVKENNRITPKNTPEVRSILLTVPHARFVYVAGQNIGFTVPGEQAYGHASHFRLYTIANTPPPETEADTDIELCVRRCFYIDEVSGEEYPGLASNYLCDLQPGDKIAITGPYGDAFSMPDDSDANLLMIGTGTGIAPFRAFIQHIYDRQAVWAGKVRLFYGARTGTENLYQNDIRNDLANYYDQETFQAFEGLTHRPWIDKEDTGLSQVLEDNAAEIWELIQDPKTHVYLAGLPKTAEDFYKAMAKIAGSETRVRWMREEMIEQKRWSELLYR
jgi:ferredoxin--NADP+ reductase